MIRVNGVNITLLTSFTAPAMVLTVIGVIKVPPAERTAPRLSPLTEGEGIRLIFTGHGVTSHVEGLPEGEGAFTVRAFYDVVHNREF